MLQKKQRRFYRSKRFWITAVLLIAAALAFQRPVLTSLLEFTAEVACGRQGLEFAAQSVKAGFFEPLVFEGVTIRVHERTGNSNSAVDIERLQLDWQKLGAFFSNPRRLISTVSIRRMNAHLDFRRAETGTPSDLGWKPVAALAALLRPAGDWPGALSLEGSRIEVETDSSRWVADRCTARVNSGGPGQLEVGALTIHTPRFERVLGPMTASTRWDGKNLSVAGLEIFPGVVADGISCVLEPGVDPSVSFQGRVFGGTLRGDWNFQRGERGAVWDFAAVCSNVALEALPAVLGIEGKTQGRLAEGRFTFRGEPGRPTDAEASLRVLAKDFRWNDRGWESLEIGASLIHRRLLVSNFDLRQSENSVTLNGEISLADGWDKITEAPFLVNLRANIKELGSLARLTGGSDQEARGALVAEGSVSGRPGSLDGFVGIRAKAIEYRGIPVDKVDMEVLFRKSLAEIVRCEVRSGKDSFVAKGQVGVIAPHSYLGELEAGLSDVAVWLRPFPALGGGMVTGGALKLKWSGDGSLEGHSGSFDLGLTRFVSGFTPAGITGKFEGTYSPKNIHLSRVEVQKERLRLQSRVTLSPHGINFDDLELGANGSDLLRGKIYLPVNPFTLRSLSEWNAAVLGTRDIYVEADTPGELELGDLAALVGQEWPIEGRLAMNVQAFGPASGIDGKLALQARDLIWRGRGDGVPSSLQLEMRTTAGAAKITGELQNPAMSPLKISASFPFGMFQDADGMPRWLQRNATVQASADFPRAELALLRPFFPSLGGLSGELSGKLDFNGTLDAPSLAGSAEIRNAAFHFGALPSPAEFVNGRLEIENGVLKIREVAGEIDPGRFEFNGECAFPEPWKPHWSMTWTGEKIPLQNDARVLLLANVDLRGKDGRLEGRVDLVDSKIQGRLEIQPFLSAPGTAGVDLKKPLRTLAALAPGGGWGLDVMVNSPKPIDIRGGAFPASMTVDLRLEGMVEAPIPVGQIRWQGIETLAPAKTFLTCDGSISFFPDIPGEAFVLAESSGFINDATFSAVAFGSLAEGKWVLRSGEPQSQFLLLREGLSQKPAPAGTMGPVEFFFLEGRDRVAALRIEDHSIEGDGMRFSDSLDFQLRGSILPASTFRSGFQWKWSPAF
ncbi:MAG: hypothetical protein ACKOAS_01175 [Verrucomicrobiota bacterium]